MKANKRKGFTLVELLVVIAILAVLATVSVIGYLSFTNKAKESNDISLTTQMNLALQANEAVDGKAKTMTDALNVLSDAGLDVTKLTPTSQGYSYVYDSESGRMLLLGKDKNIIAPEGATDSNKIDTFAIVKTEEELSDWTEADYGVYLADGYTGATELTTLTSVDVGDENIKSLTINDDTSTNQAIVNAKLDNLELNVPEGSVDFYGDATLVSASTANNSLHVYGHIQELNLKQGKVVVKSNGEVNTIDAREAVEGSAIEVETNGTVGAIISETQDIVTGGNVTVTNPSDVADGFAGGIGTEKSPYLINSIEDWKNMTKTGTHKTGYYFNVLTDLDFSEDLNYCIAFKGNIDFLGHNVYLNKNDTYQCLFWNVYSNSTISNLNYHLSSDLVNPFVIYTANLDSNDDIVLNSINVYGNVSTSDNNFGLVSFVKGYNKPSTLKFINCNNYSNIISNASNSAGIFLGKVYDDESYGTAKISFELCSNYGSLIHPNGYASMLVGNSCSFQHNTLNDFIVTNCHNYGTILGGSENTNLFCGSGWNSDTTIDDIKEWISANSDNLKNVGNGICYQTNFENISISASNPESFDFSNVITNEGYTYVISFNFWLELFSDESKTQKKAWGSYGITIDLGNDLSEINSYNWISETDIVGTPEYESVEIGDKILKTCKIDGEKYFVVEKNNITSGDGYISISNPNLSLFVYDSSMKFVTAYTYAY